MQNKRKIIIPIALILPLLVSLFYFFFNSDLENLTLSSETQPQLKTASSRVYDEEPSDQEISYNGDRINVLILGLDARPGVKNGRTDTMMLVSIDKKTKKIAIISIPRDSLVEISGHGKDKINAANIFGGVDLSMKTVENLLGIKIPYYVRMNFQGFKEIVDILGGVNINVDKTIVKDNVLEKKKTYITLQPGPQKLDGTRALAYIRYRNDALGDITRTKRQQNFLNALAYEMLQVGVITKLPKLIPAFMEHIETNFNARDIIILARFFSQIKPGGIKTATLPGNFYNYNGISYWKTDESKNKLLLDNLFKGLYTPTISSAKKN